MTQKRDKHWANKKNIRLVECEKCQAPFEVYPYERQQLTNEDMKHICQKCGHHNIITMEEYEDIFLQELEPVDIINVDDPNHIPFVCTQCGNKMRFDILSKGMKFNVGITNIKIEGDKDYLEVTTTFKVDQQNITKFFNILKSNKLDINLTKQIGYNVQDDPDAEIEDGY